SGGNQQKVVLAKWMTVAPRVLLFDEPTRGVDVGAKAAIHDLMRELAQDGMAVLMISSELPELIGMSDRIVVLRDGRLVGELPAGSTEEAVMRLAAAS
ncbi:sugar ABC transporter ATP-binding protein, partial [Microbispora triticiradicis]|nr:sugar ABC transporter ATP-binding protein [Microbispora triticiradicis]